jgi:hypothetical protein
MIKCFIITKYYGHQLKDEMGRACSMTGEDKKYIQNFSRKSVEQRLHSRPRCKWDDIKTDMQIKCDGMDWVYLA